MRFQRLTLLIIQGIYGIEGNGFLKFFMRHGAIPNMTEASF
jgi:hypothetical protein